MDVVGQTVATSHALRCAPDAAVRDWLRAFVDTLDAHGARACASACLRLCLSGDAAPPPAVTGRPRARPAGTSSALEDLPSALGCYAVRFLRDRDRRALGQTCRVLHVGSKLPGAVGCLDGRAMDDVPHQRYRRAYGLRVGGALAVPDGLGSRLRWLSVDRLRLVRQRDVAAVRGLPLLETLTLTGRCALRVDGALVPHEVALLPRLGTLRVESDQLPACQSQRWAPFVAHAVQRAPRGLRLCVPTAHQAVLRAVASSATTLRGLEGAVRSVRDLRMVRDRVTDTVVVRDLLDDGHGGGGGGAPHLEHLLGACLDTGAATVRVPAVASCARMESRLRRWAARAARGSRVGVRFEGRAHETRRVRPCAVARLVALLWRQFQAVEVWWTHAPLDNDSAADWAAELGRVLGAGGSVFLHECGDVLCVTAVRH